MKKLDPKECEKVLDHCWQEIVGKTSNPQRQCRHCDYKQELVVEKKETWKDA